MRRKRRTRGGTSGQKEGLNEVRAWSEVKKGGATGRTEEDGRDER
jgi:hypothetical protein